VSPYQDFFVCQKYQFSIGRMEELNTLYISFLEPTLNRQSDYEVYFRLPHDLRYLAKDNPEELRYFVEQCRHGLYDELKID
jgi:hypothetical protein